MSVLLAKADFEKLAFGADEAYPTNLSFSLIPITRLQLSNARLVCPGRSETLKLLLAAIKLS